jgi:carbamoyltransferase
MIILGINNMHDASAVLVVDGKVVAAAEEERFVRVKHTKGFPRHAMKFCLDYAGITMKDVDILCAAWKPWVLRVRATQALRSFMHSPKMFHAKVSRGVGQMRNEWAELFQFKRLTERHFGKGNYRTEFVAHHLAHAASAFLCSPFENAAVLTVDGAGEADTTVLWKGQGTDIKKIKSIRLPHSLGQFYSAVTAFLGFKIQSDEYKVMGLASYGEPVYKDYLSTHVIRLNSEGLFHVDPYFIDYHLARNGRFRKTSIDIFGEPRKNGEEITKQHANVAASAQAVVEETIFHLTNYLYEVTKIDTLGLAGGVAFNCVANGKLFHHTPFKNIFIQPAAGDAGSALGAALYLEQKYAGKGRQYILDNAYYGPSFNSDECEGALKRANLPYEKLTEVDLVKRTVQFLVDGKPVCWFQGRMEWGPRALGNRSFLADPRREEMKDIINLKIKKREPFRPFAPSVLEEKSPEYFEHPGPSPFMLYACEVKPDKKRRIPAVTHVDGTARPQTVNRDTNPRYWNLIKEFERSTGIPVILNTSFNVQEPIVCTPDEAIQAFLKTDVDVLVLNDFFIERSPRGE